MWEMICDESQLVAAMITGLSVQLLCVKDRADEDAARSKVGAHNVLSNILPRGVPIRSLLEAEQCSLYVHHIFHGFRLGAISMDRIVRGRKRMEMLPGAKLEIMMCSPIFARAASP